MTDDKADGGPATTGFTRVGRGPRRMTRWDRPPEPKDWRFFVGWLGRSLITLGLLMFLFVAYQLWGTGIETARAQNRLEDEFAALLEENALEPSVTPPVTTAAPAPTTAAPTPTTQVAGSIPVTSSTAPAPTTVTPLPEVVPAEQQNLPSFERGDAVARLVIPRIDLDWVVVSGVTRNDLKLGPGHFRDTPLPGQLGNSAIAGHRTTSGAPFGSLDSLAPGDEVELTMPNGHRYVYVVSGSEVVTPDEYGVISRSDESRATLTLVTCTPKWSSTHRLIVYAELDQARSGPIGEPIITGEPEAPELDVPPDTSLVTAPASTPALGTGAPTSEPAVPTGSIAPPASSVPVAPDDDIPDAPEESDAFSQGWFHDSDAWPQILLWGLALILIVTGGWWLARSFKREWVGALAGFVPFFVSLYFFFQNVNRLLPPGL